MSKEEKITVINFILEICSYSKTEEWTSVSFGARSRVNKDFILYELSGSGEIS